MSTIHSHPGQRGTAHTAHGPAANRARRLEQMLAAQVRLHAAHAEAVKPARQIGTPPGLHLDRILVPLDFSESSVEALRFALPFARESGACLDLLHVVQPFVLPLGPGGEAAYVAIEGIEKLRRDANARLKKLAAAEVGRPVRANVLVREGSPAQVINAVAAERRSDLLLVSTHGHTGLKRFLLGSTAEAVVRRAPCPVLTVRRRVLARGGTPQSPPSERINRILVPVDFSAASEAMLRYAVAFARRFRAALLLLHVVDRINVPSRVVYYATRLQLVVQERAIRQLAEFAERVLPQDLEAEQLVLSGTPYDVINQVARRERVDLIIVATRGHGAVKRFFIGGTAGRVVRHAPCPVLVVR